MARGDGSVLLGWLMRRRPFRKPLRVALFVNLIVEMLLLTVLRRRR